MESKKKRKRKAYCNFSCHHKNLFSRLSPRITFEVKSKSNLINYKVFELIYVHKYYCFWPNELFTFLKI